MINIKSYATDKESQGSSTQSLNTGFTKAVNATVQGVNIWGQYHDHTSDINGDMRDVGSIEMTGDLNALGNVNCYNGNITNKLTADQIDANYGSITEIYANNGDIGNINATTITANDSVTTDELISNDIHNSNAIYTKDLNVTGSAHFFELVIDKIKAAGGSVLLTPADGFKIDRVDDAGVFEVDDMQYADNDQVFIKDNPFYFTFPDAPKGKNILAEFTTDAHNIKFFYSWGVNQRSAILYSDGTLRTGTYGNSNDSFVSPYIYVGDIDTIVFESDGMPQASGENAKIAAYDENLNYIQSNSRANVQTFTWTRGETTKWIRFTGRNSFGNGKIYLNNQKTGDITIKYIWEDYKKNGTSTSTSNIPMIFLNKCKGFKLYRDNSNTVFQNKDEMVLNAVPIVDSNYEGGLYDKISQTYAVKHGTTNNYKAGAKTDQGYSVNTGYKLMFQSNDGERAIKNMWKVNDQAICQSFNEAEVGTTSQVSNKYYWTLVTNVGTVTVDDVEYHFIDVSSTTYDGTLNPEAGDEIAMLGYRGTDDADRQCAIYIAAYNSLDTGISAPLIAQYTGINDFNLSNHRGNTISNGFNQFKGTFETNSGDDIEQLINDVGQGAISYVHFAWANNDTGTLNFSKTYFNNALYVGVCSNHTESDSALTASDYIWQRLKGNDGANGQNGQNGQDGQDGADGADGEDALMYMLVPTDENAYVNASGDLGLVLNYQIVKIEGETYSIVAPSLRGMRFVFDAWYSSQLLPTRYDANDSAVNWTINRESMMYSNSSFQSGWKTATFTKLQRVEVLLIDGDGNVYDRRVVYPTLLPMATFTITDNITSVVQGHTTSINGIENDISTIEQNMNSITLTVNQTKNGLAQLQYDSKNLYGVSSFAGSELEEGNRWLFVSDASYSFDLWDNYMCVFENGLNQNRWIMLAAGTSTIYAPYLYMYSNQTYTLNMEFLKYDGTNAIKLYKYNNTTDAQTLTATQEWYLNYSGQLVTTRPNGHDYDTSDVIQFSVPSSGYYRLGFQNIIINYTPADDNYCDLNYVRLYRGAYDADEFGNWNSQLSESYSRMYMDSGKISLSVNDVSLQLDGLRNNIVLNGNTIINGTLNLNDSTQGLVLTGDNGVTKFSPESIGTWDDWSGKTLAIRDVNQYEDATPEKSGNTYQTISTFEYVYGMQKAGEPILISDLLISITGNTPTSISTSLIVYQGNTITDTYTFTGTTLPETYEWDTSAAAKIKFKFVITATYSTNTPSSVDLTYKIITPITAMLQLGYDGLGALYNGGESAIYFGQEGAVITYGNYGLKVNDTGVYSWLQDNTYGGWHKMQKDLNVKTITASYTLKYDDDFIIGNSNSNITLTLPYDMPAGKKIYVKNMTSRTFTVSCQNRIVLQDSISPQSTFTTGNRMYFIIWDGNYWYVGYAG